MEKIPVTLTTHYKEKPVGSDIPFGVIMTDHMFLMNYDPEHGWHDGRIVPYAPFQIDPACMVLHYAQEIFEGMKATGTLRAGFACSARRRTSSA